MSKVYFPMRFFPVTTPTDSRPALTTLIVDHVMERVPICSCGLVRRDACEGGCGWTDHDFSALRRKAIANHVRMKLLGQRDYDVRIAYRHATFGRFADALRLAGIDLEQWEVPH